MSVLSDCRETVHLLHLFFVVVGVVAALLHGSTLHATSSAAAIRRGEGVVDVLLRVDSNEKRGRVAHLLSNTDVSLLDQHTGVVDGLGQAALEDLSLKASLEHLLAGHGEGIIQLSLSVVQQTHSHQLAQESLALELTGLAVLLKSQQVTSSRSDLGKSVHDSPNLSLVLQTVRSNNLELGVKSRLLVRSSGGLSGLGIVAIVLSHVKRTTYQSSKEQRKGTAKIDRETEISRSGITIGYAHRVSN